MGNNMDKLTNFSGPSHEENSKGGIPVGPNATVEGGETMDKSQGYVFSDRNVIDKDIASEFNLSKKWIGKTFAEASDLANRKHTRREDDPIEQEAITRDLDNLRNAQEAWKQRELQKDLDMMNQKHPEFMMQMQQQGQQTQPMAAGGFTNNPPANGNEIPEYRTKTYNIRGKDVPYSELTLQDRRFLDYKYGYSGYETPEGTIEYQKGTPGYNYATSIMAERQGVTGPELPPSATHWAQKEDVKWATYQDPETGESWYIPAQGKYPAGIPGATIQQKANGGGIDDVIPGGPDKSGFATQTGVPGVPMPEEYRAAFIKTTGQVPPDDAYISNAAAEAWAADQSLLGWVAPLHPDDTSAPGSTIGTTTETGEFVFEPMPGPHMVAAANMPAEPSGPTATDIERQRNKDIIQSLSANPEGQAILQAAKAAGQTPMAYMASQNIPVENFAGGGFVQGLGKGMETLSGLAGLIPGVGTLASAGLGAVGAGLQNVGTGADFKEVAKDVAFGAGKGALSGITMGAAGAAGEAAKKGAMASAGLEGANVLENTINANTTDASEQKTLDHQAALEREQQLRANPNLDIQGITAAYGGYLDDPPKKQMSQGTSNWWGTVSTILGIPSTEELKTLYNVATMQLPERTLQKKPNLPKISTAAKTRAYGGYAMQLGDGGKLSHGGYHGGPPYNPMYPTQQYTFGQSTSTEVPEFDPNNPLGGALTMPNQKINSEVYTDDYLQQLAQSELNELKKLEEEESKYDLTPTPLERIAPIAGISYNLIQAMRKPGLLNAADYMDKTQFTERDINIQPYITELNKSIGAGRKLGAKSQSAIRNLINRRNEALGKLFMSKEQMEEANKQYIEGAKSQQAQRNAAVALGVEDLNQKAIAAKQTYIQEAIRQTMDLVQAGRADKQDWAFLNAVAPDMAQLFSYRTFGEDMKQRRENRKSKKKK